MQIRGEQLAESDKVLHLMMIDGIEFSFVDDIELNRDPRGRPVEERPASRDDNRKNLRLNKHGQGPFCHFRIEPDKQTLDSLGVYAIVENPSSVLYIGRRVVALQSGRH